MNHILVCGGAGYIGAHMVKHLVDRGYRVTVFDNFSTGHRQAVRWGELVEGDLLDPDALKRLLATHEFDAVIHFAALSVIAESVREPQLYYRNNVTGTLNLIVAMRGAGVGKLVFSSTASVYGEPQTAPIDETHPLAPINPYGASKAMAERILADTAAAYGLRSASLRYFNAAGADPGGEIGESHEPETHLIPNVLKAAASGSPVSIFGDDYDTRDGTCVRDYIHVNDLAAAHLAALDYLNSNAGAHTFNLGSGTGFSVLEIVDAVRRVTGKKIHCERAARRPGDPPTLIASSESARRSLGWRPVCSGIDAIIETAWRWHRVTSY